MSSNLPIISKQASEIATQAQHLAHMIEQEATQVIAASNGGSSFVFFLISIQSLFSSLSNTSRPRSISALTILLFKPVFSQSTCKPL